MHTQRTELFDVVVDVLVLGNKIDTNSIASAQDAMLNLRIDWEELQSRLKNRKVDGFEVVISAMKQLAATAIAMSASLQSKLLTQREYQLTSESEEDRTPMFIPSTVAKKAVKPPDKKKKRTLSAK